MCAAVGFARTSIPSTSYKLLVWSQPCCKMTGKKGERENGTDKVFYSHALELRPSDISMIQVISLVFT